MFMTRLIPVVAALVCSIGVLDASDAEASHGRGKRRRCRQPVETRAPACCEVERCPREEWMEWHPDCCGGHQHRYQAFVDGDCRRRVVEVPMERSRVEPMMMAEDCVCRR